VLRIDQSLPFPGMGEREWRLWLELWGQAARRPELRPVAARLYARYDRLIVEGLAAELGIEVTAFESRGET
jgi:hypothetical protein